MKILLLLFLVGFAAASFHQQLEDVPDDEFIELLQDLEFADEDTNDVAKRLRETFDDILQKIKDSIDQGKGVKEDLMNKLKEIREKMKDLKVDLGNKAKELLEKVKERVKDFWKKILDKLKDVKDDNTSETEIQMAGFNIKEMFKKLKEQLLAKIDKEKLKAKIEEIFGKGSEMADNIMKVINEKGDKYKQKLLDLVDRYLKKEDEKRALNEMFEFADEDTNDVAKRLRETFDDILQKIKDSIDQGKGVKEDLMNKLKDIREKMKDLKVDLGNKAKELLEKVKERVKDFWKKILDKLKDVKDDASETEIQMASFDIKEMFKKLKEQLLSKINKEKLKAKIEEIFGKGSEMADNIMKVINEKGDKYKQKLLDLVDRYLKKEDEKRSLNEMFEFAEEDDNTKTELGKRLRKTLDEILEKIRDAVDQGKGVKEDLMTKLKDIREKMRDLKVDLGKKAKELLEKVRERVKNFWKDILDKLKDVNDKETQEAEIQRVDLKEMFRKLKKQILAKIDKEKLKAKIEEIFGKGSEMAESLLKLINEKGDKVKQKLLDLIDRYLDEKETEKRSIKEMWEKLKDYFKDLQIDLKEKYMKFGEWVKTVADKALQKGKGKIENIKAIAKEFVEHTKGVSKEVAVEALEFLKPYKEDLGALWDQVKVAVKDIVQKKD